MSATDTAPATVFAEAMASAIQEEARRLLPLWEEALAPYRRREQAAEEDAARIRAQARTIVGASSVADADGVGGTEYGLLELLWEGSEAGPGLASWAQSALDRLQSHWDWREAASEAAPARAALAAAEAESFLRLQDRAKALVRQGHLPPRLGGFSWILHPDTFGVECQDNGKGGISLFPRW